MNISPSTHEKTSGALRHAAVRLTALALALCLLIPAPLTVFATEAPEPVTSAETGGEAAPQETAPAEVPAETPADSGETPAVPEGETVPEVSDEAIPSGAAAPWIEGAAGFLMEANTGLSIFL